MREAKQRVIWGQLRTDGPFRLAADRSSIDFSHLWERAGDSEKDP